MAAAFGDFNDLSRWAKKQVHFQPKSAFQTERHACPSVAQPYQRLD
jgi:hypothetical protein